MSETKLTRAVNMIIRTNQMYRALIELRVGSLGIHRTQHRILMHLARHDRLPSQKELAAHLGVTPAAVTGALKKLEKDNYVQRTLGHDNRYNELSITEKGRELVNTTRELFFEVDSAVFSGFTDEELDLYISCLERMQGNINKQSEMEENK